MDVSLLSFKRVQQGIGKMTEILFNMSDRTCGHIVSPKLNVLIWDNEHFGERSFLVELVQRPMPAEANGSLQCGQPTAFKAGSIAKCPNLTLLQMNTEVCHPQAFVSFFHSPFF